MVRATELTDEVGLACCPILALAIAGDMKLGIAGNMKLNNQFQAVGEMMGLSTIDTIDIMEAADWHPCSDPSCACDVDEAVVNDPLRVKLLDACGLVEAA